MNIRNILTSALQVAANSTSYDEDMSQSDQIYLSTFIRGLPVCAGEIEEEYLPLGVGYAQKDLSDIPSAYEMDMDQEEYDQWVVEVSIPLHIITRDVLLIETCNYKGEGMGFVMYDDAKEFSVFVSKNDSFGIF